MAPSNRRTSKDLLRLEHSDTSSTPGGKFLSVCKAKKSQNIHPSSSRTMPLEGVVGESSVLRRVQAFLPVLDEANRKLADAIKEKGPDVYDIEVLKSHEANAYVEMDLALGVADLHSVDAVSAAERLAGGQAYAAPSGIKADSDNESCHSSSEDENDAKSPLTKQKRRPKVEPLS